jgi:hypothetical protein
MDINSGFKNRTKKLEVITSWKEGAFGPEKTGGMRALHPGFGEV